MEKMLSLSLRDFSQAVASDSFSPGGGGCSAYAGALGASLGHMVLTLTIGKKKYAEFDEANRRLQAEMKQLAEALLGCVERDHKGCERILEAMALPKDTESEKMRRKSAIAEASKVANEAPIDVTRLALKVLQLMKNGIAHVNRNCITDWACGALQAYAALEGAAMNAKINCGSVEDHKYCSDVRDEMRNTLGEGRRLLDEIRNHVHSSIDASN
ncbi:MAG TPA: cyclodeaminase/cyclohydrolase family protein [Candidatus Ozemobacteraceae bacterium]|nr:cyclodeaminase/cyclohydrolase family protein [Candidatus Ozemobacteraceae bacterium]